MSGPNASGWVTLEGANGVGKTHLAHRAATRLGPICLPLVELPNVAPAQLPGQIIKALHSAGDPFLRTGVPRTETLLLAALQVHRHETARPEPGQVVLEDRGPYSVAVYQTVILSSPVADDAELLSTAKQILDTISQWRPLPERVLLLVDDPDTALARYEHRTGRPVRDDESALIERAARLYEALAAADPGDIQVLDRRRLTEDECVTAIVHACRAATDVPARPEVARREGERS